MNNFGKNQDGQNDPETGNTQAGAVSGGAPSYLGRDNANQITLQDGVAPITNMYLWQPIAGAFYAPCVDGDYDMSIIGHEYTHMISNRMVGGPDSSLTGHQAGSMGESWSDLTAVEYLHENGYAADRQQAVAMWSAPMRRAIQTRGIRNFTNFVADRQSTELRQCRLRYDRAGGPRRRRDLGCGEPRGAPRTDHQVQRGVSVHDKVQQAKCAARRRAGLPLPRQSPLDAAGLRRLPADAARGQHARCT